jgi:hypothetical protein
MGHENQEVKQVTLYSNIYGYKKNYKTLIKDCYIRASATLTRICLCFWSSKAALFGREGMFFAIIIEH